MTDWNSATFYPVALSAGGAILIAGLLLAARALGSRRRAALAALAAGAERRRDRAILSLSEALGRDRSAHAVLREAAGCAAVVSNCEAVETFAAAGPGEIAGSLRRGPVYPDWFVARAEGGPQRALAHEAIESGVPVQARETPVRPGCWLAVPAFGAQGPVAAFVLHRPGDDGWSSEDLACLTRVARLAARALDRLAQETSLEGERDRFAALHRDTPDMDLLLDSGGRILRASRRVTDVLGYAPEEIEGESLAKLIAPGRGIEVEELLLETLLHGRLHRDALPLRRVDGQVIDSLLEAVPVRAARGGTAGFRLTLRENSGIGDLIDDQAAEIERLEAALESAREELVWAEADWYAHEEDLQGAMRETLLEREEFEARRGLVHARERLDHERELASLRELLEQKRLDRPEARPQDRPNPAREQSAPGPYGEPAGKNDRRPLEASQALVDRDSGRILEAGTELALLLGVGPDDLVGQRLSELHGIDRVPGLRRKYEDLIEDGRGMLGGLPAAAAEASRAEAPPGVPAWSVEVARWTGEAEAVGIAADRTLLVTWRPEDRTLEESGPRPLRDLLEGCVRAAGNEAGRRRITVNLSIADDPLLEREAPAELAEAVSELIEHSLRLTPAGGEIRVEAGCVDDARTGREVRVVIRDNGIGIPTEDLDRLFELGQPGSSSVPASMQAGRPAEVSRCPAIVQRLGGRFAAESQVGLGTEFRLTLPGLPQ